MDRIWNRIFAYRIIDITNGQNIKKQKKVRLTKSSFIKSLIKIIYEIKLNKSDINNIFTKLNERISYVNSVRIDMNSHDYHYQKLKLDNLLVKSRKTKKYIE